MHLFPVIIIFLIHLKFTKSIVQIVCHSPLDYTQGDTENLAELFGYFRDYFSNNDFVSFISMISISVGLLKETLDFR